MCRTDLFLKAPQETHDAAMLDEAIARVRAYAEAGASGFFVPMLGGPRLLAACAGESPVPVNFMTYPGCPSNAEVAATGVARISHGPFPYMALMAQLEAGGAGGARPRRAAFAAATASGGSCPTSARCGGRWRRRP